MRLVHAPDGTVDRRERALFLTVPFDITVYIIPNLIIVTNESLALATFSAEYLTVTVLGNESLKN